MKTKMQSFIESADKAIKSNLKYMAIAITIGNSDKPEIILNSRENFKQKIDYYKVTYDEDMKHKYSKDIDIRISGFMFTNNLNLIKNFFN